MSAVPVILRQPTLSDLEGLGGSYERSPWVPPSIATAKEHRKQNSFAGGRAPLWATTADDIATASVGSAMLLRSLHALMCMFILMAAVTTPSIAIFWSGSRVPTNLPDPLRFAHLSLGNAGPLALDQMQALSVADNATSSNFPAALGSGSWSKVADGTALASRSYVQLAGADLTGEKAAWLIASLDAIACFLALIMYCMCSRRLRVMSNMDHQRRISAGDFTVMVTGLPPDATKQEVIAHFCELFALDGTGIVDMFGVCRPPPDPAAANPPSSPPSKAAAQAAAAATTAGAAAGAGFSSASAETGTAVDVDGAAPQTMQLQDFDQQQPALEAEAEGQQHELQQQYLQQHELQQQQQQFVGAPEAGELHAVPGQDGVDHPSLVPAEGTGVAAGGDGLPTAIATAGIDHATGPDGRSLASPQAIPTPIQVEGDDLTAVGAGTGAAAGPGIDWSQAPQPAAAGAAAAPLASSGTMSSPVHIFAPPPPRQPPAPTAPPASVDPRPAIQPPPSVHVPPPPKPVKLSQVSNAVRSRLSKGIVTDADPHLAMAHPLDIYAATDGGRVADDAGADEELVGGWLADVVLVPRDMTPAVAALKAAKTVQALRQARADFKMHRVGTSSRKGPNLKLQMSAFHRIQKLEYTLGKTIASLAAHHAGRQGEGDSPQGSDGYGEDAAMSASGRSDNLGAGIAFVTFNAEESLQRCLMAYAGSSQSWFRRLWQNPLLRFRRPPPEVARKMRCMLCCQGRRLGYTLKVVQAPEPLDIKHENLGAPAATRCCLRLLTSLTTVILVLIGLAGMVVSQSYSQAVSAQLPDLTLCNTHIPAAFLGGYSNATAVSNALAAGYGGVIVNLAGYVAGGTNFSDSYNLIPYSSTTPQLVRPVASDERSTADAACGVTKFSVVYRYDFTGIPPSDRAAYTGVPIVNTTSITKQAAVVQPSSRYFVGTAVPYGTIARACSSAVLQAAVNTTGGQAPITHPACPDPRKLNVVPTLNHCQCIEPSSSSNCYTLPCYASTDAWRHATTATQAGNTPVEQACITYPVSTLAGCYCVQSLNRNIAMHGTIAGFVGFASSEKDVCTDFANVYVAAQVIVIATAASASIINIALGLIIPWLVSLEKHISVSEEQSALITKVSVAQLVNTLLTVLLVNAKLPSSVSLPSVLASIGLLNGAHPDFQTAWYATIGSSICLSVLINITVALVTKLITFTRFWYKLCMARRGALQVATQEQLNNTLCGPPINLTSTYPALIVTLFSCTVYSAGMPLLHWFGFGAMVLSYAMDKLLLLRYHRLSTNAATWPAHALIGSIPFAIFLHMCFGVWMLGADAILWPATYASVAWGSLQSGADRWMSWLLSLARSDPLRVAARLWLAHTFPTLIVLLLIVAVVVLRILAAPAGVILRRIWAALVTSTENQTEKAAASLRSVSSISPTRLRSTWFRDALASSSSAIGSEPRGVAAHTPLHGIAPTDIMPSYLWQALARLPAISRGLQVQGAALRALRKRGLTLAQGGTIGRGKGLAPWTSDFFRIYDPVFGKTLSGAQQLQGWRLQELNAQSWMDVHAQKAATQYAQLEAAGVNLRAIVSSTQAAKRALAAAQPKPQRRRFCCPGGGSSQVVPVTPSVLADPSESPEHATSPQTSVRDALISAHSSNSHDVGGFAPAVMVPGIGTPSPSAGDGSGGGSSGSGSDSQPEFPHVYILRKFRGMDADSMERTLLPKRTWEVIADAGLTSYDYRKHPAYQAARILAAEQERFIAMMEEPPEGVPSVSHRGRRASLAAQSAPRDDEGEYTTVQTVGAPAAGGSEDY